MGEGNVWVMEEERVFNKNFFLVLGVGDLELDFWIM